MARPPAQRGQFPDSIELYDLSTGRAVITGHLGMARAVAAAVALADGGVLLAGGWKSLNAGLATAELIDPVAGTASPAASMAAPLTEAPAIALPDGRALIVGGVRGASGAILDRAEVYLP